MSKVIARQKVVAATHWLWGGGWTSWLALRARWCSWVACDGSQRTGWWVSLGGRVIHREFYQKTSESAAVWHGIKKGPRSSAFWSYFSERYITWRKTSLERNTPLTQSLKVWEILMTDKIRKVKFILHTAQPRRIPDTKLKRSVAQVERSLLAFKDRNLGSNLYFSTC